MFSGRRTRCTVPARMTWTAYKQGLRNALVCVVLVLIVWLAIAGILALALRRDVAEELSPSFAVLWVSVLVAFAAEWIYGRVKGGRILLDCGPHPARWLFLFNAVLFLFIGIGHESSGHPLQATQLLSFSVYWLVLGSGHLQVRENGIWRYAGLLRWDRVKSYHWLVDSSLRIKSKGSLLQAALPVPPERKQAVSELLGRFCSAPPDFMRQ